MFPGLHDLVTAEGRIVADELARRAAGVATALRRSHDAGPGVVVPVAPRPTVAGIATLWGVWWSGAIALVVDERDRRHLDTAGRWGSGPIVDEIEPEDPAPRVPRGAEDPHTVVFTSGSGGDPRPVVLTGGNVTAAVAASRRRLGNLPGDRWLLTLPLFHVGGLSVLWRSAEAGGVVVAEPFDAERVATLLPTVAWASLVPTMLRRVLDAGTVGSPVLRGVLVGGAAASRELLAEALDAGIPALATYGSTETCSQVATVAPGRAREDLGTVGRPLAGIRVTIVGADGTPLSTGVTGRIVVAGPTVSPGVLGEPVRRGPITTSDLGRFDDVGRLVIVGRVDAAIVTGGEKVLPDAVEAALATHPAVTTAVVVGVDDPLWGQVVAAVVEGDADTTDLAEHARRRLPPHAVPRRWRVVERIPTLPGGKPDRRAVAAMFR